MINGSDKKVAVLRERMEEKRLKVKDKKIKKAKNGEVTRFLAASIGEFYTMAEQVCLSVFVY